MKFEEEPNYEFLKGLFVKVLTDQKEEIDYMYDWSKEKPIKTLEEIKAEKIEGNDLNIDINNMKMISHSNDELNNQNASSSNDKIEERYVILIYY